MNYKITSIKNHQVVLARSNIFKYIFVPVFLLISIFFFLISSGAFGDASTYASGFLYAGMGLIFSCGGLMLAFQMKIPYEIIFNNETGTVIINEKLKGILYSAKIPYKDILDFNLTKHRSKKSSSCNVDMEKTDGAIWTLYSVSTEKNALKFYETLKNNVTLKNKSYMVSENIEQGGIQISEEGDSVYLSWKKKHTLSGSIIGLFFLAGWVMALFGARAISYNQIAYWLAVAFIVFIVFLVIFYIVFSIGKKYIIKISNEMVSFYTSGGIFNKKIKSIRLEDIDSVLFNFSVSSGDMIIYIVSKKEKDIFQSIKKGNVALSDIINAMLVMKDMMKIDVGELGITEKINVENLIQKYIKEKMKLENL